MPVRKEAPKKEVPAVTSAPKAAAAAKTSVAKSALQLKVDKLCAEGKVSYKSYEERKMELTGLGKRTVAFLDFAGNFQQNVKDLLYAFMTGESEYSNHSIEIAEEDEVFLMYKENE